MPIFSADTNVFSEELSPENITDATKNVEAQINENYYFKNADGKILNATGVFKRIYYSLKLRQMGEKDSTRNFIPLFIGKYSYDFMMTLSYILSSRAKIGIICPNNFKEEFYKTKNNLEYNSSLKTIFNNCNLILVEELTENPNDKRLIISNFNLVKHLSKIDLILINPVELKFFTNEQINCIIGNGTINYIDIDGNVKQFNGNKLLSLAFSHKNNCILDEHMDLNWEVYYPYC